MLVARGSVEPWPGVTFVPEFYLYTRACFTRRNSYLVVGCDVGCPDTEYDFFRVRRWRSPTSEKSACWNAGRGGRKGVRRWAGRSWCLSEVAWC